MDVPSFTLDIQKDCFETMRTAAINCFINRLKLATFIGRVFLDHHSVLCLLDFALSGGTIHCGANTTTNILESFYYQFHIDACIYQYLVSIYILIF